MAWTSPRTWLAGEKPAASVYNQHIRDNLKAIGDPWTSYSVAWTAGTSNPAIGNGTLTGAYMQAGKLTMLRIRIVMGSTTTFGSGEYRFSYPFTAANTNNPGGGGYVFRASTWSSLNIVGRDVNVFRVVNTATNAIMASNSPVVFAANDEIHLGLTYESA